MKFVLIACVVFVAAVSAQDEIVGDEVARPIDPIDQERLCPRRLKCGRGARPVIAHDNCQCTYFRTDCARLTYNAVMGPPYDVVLDDRTAQKRCPCYATPDWLKAPTSQTTGHRCLYRYRDFITRDCIPWITADCSQEEVIPVPMKDGCGCKIFPNNCYYQQFTCNYEHNYVEIEPEEDCSCKYNSIIRAEPIEIEIKY